MQSTNRNRAPESNNDQVIQIRRVNKKTKGGNRPTFTALVVTGDKLGKVGVGLGKAPTVVAAIKKASRLARRDMVQIPLKDGTIPFPINQKFKGARLMLRPAPQGTGVIAGGAVRSVVEMAGVKNIVTKCLGGSNKMSNVFATFKAMRAIEVMGHKRDQLHKKYESK